jgi:hypothetical protein
MIVDSTEIPQLNLRGRDEVQAYGDRCLLRGRNPLTSLRKGCSLISLRRATAKSGLDAEDPHPARSGKVGEGMNIDCSFGTVRLLSRP